ncbi:MAG: hypothetical protein KDM91_03995 [Verrucomicrobiae bacterium]|nr:hypothetical protein [Verrucomicrobiae bacterium]
MALFDELGAPVGQRVVEKANSVAGTVGKFAAPRSDTGFRIGWDEAEGAFEEFLGRISRVRFFTGTMSPSEEEQIARETAEAHTMNAHTVTNLAAAGPGSLRDSVEAAIANTGPDLIEFETSLLSPGAEISWLGPELVIPQGDRVKIVAESEEPDRKAVDLTREDPGRFFQVLGQLELKGIGLGGAFEGDDWGGAISNAGILELTDCEFFFNRAEQGGAIVNYSSGTLRIFRCSFTDNQCLDGQGGWGGALYLSSGDCEIEQSYFFRNRAGDGFAYSGGLRGEGGLGGAIYQEDASLTVRDCYFADNFAGDGGDGPEAAPGGAGGTGGAVYSDGDLRVERTFFRGGGAGVSSAGNPPAEGGFIHNTGGNLTEFENCTFTGLQRGETALTSESEWYLRHCTIAGNDLATVAIRSRNASPNLLILENSLIAGHPVDFEGFVDLTGNNIVRNTQNLTASGNGTILDVDPLLTPLQEPFGEMTPFFGLRPDSPAIDGAEVTGDTPETDQRGNPREEGPPDIGAVEMPTEFFVEAMTFPEERRDHDFELRLTRAAPASMTARVLVLRSDPDDDAREGEDFVASDGEFTIPAGETRAVVPIRILDDAVPESDETFTVVVLPTGNQSVFEGSVKGTILDDDAAVGEVAGPNSPVWFRGNRDEWISPAEGPGAYAGILWEVGPGSVLGKIDGFPVREDGTFSASLWWRGERLALRGRFEFDGANHVFAERRALGSGRLLDFFIGIERTDTGAVRLTGSVAEDGAQPRVADFFLTRNVFDPTRNPSPHAGRYTALAPLPENAAGDPLPRGDSWAVVTMDPGGRVRMQWRLADGTRFSKSAALSQDGEWSFYQPVRAGRSTGGVFAGSLAMNPTGLSDFEGKFHWNRPANPRDSRFPDGFDLHPVGVGSRFEDPGPGQAILGGLGQNSERNARVSFVGIGNDPGKIETLIIRWSERNRIGYRGPERFAARVNSRTGTIAGAYRDGATAFSFAGVVFQKQNLVGGSFLDPAGAGLLAIEGGDFDFPGSLPLGASRDVAFEVDAPLADVGVRAPLSADAAGAYFSYGDGAPGAGSFLNMRVRSDGGFSTAFLHAGQRYGLRGTFAADGSFSGNARARNGDEVGVVLEIRETAGGVRRLRAVVDTWAEYVLSRQFWNSRTNSSPRTGRHLLLYDQPFFTAPRGHSYLLVSVQASGRVLGQARLSDGTRVSFANTLSEDEKWQFFTQIYGSRPLRGYFSAQCEFLGDEIGSLARWVKFADPRESRFPFGFSGRMLGRGMAWIPPGRGERSLPGLLDSPHNARVVLEDALPPEVNGRIERVVTWDQRDRIRHYGPDRLRVLVNRRTGEVTGTLPLDGGERSVFRGVVFGDLVKGHHLTGIREPGTFTLESR